MAALILPVRCACCATHCGSSWRRRPTTSMSPTCARTWPRCQGSSMCTTHVWTITSGVPALTAHVVVDRSTLDQCGPSSMLDQLQGCAKRCFDIEHTTFQVEPADHAGHEPGRTRRTVAGYRGGTVPVAPASPPWSSWIARWPGSCPLTRKERAIRQPTGHPATSGLFGPHRA